MSTKKADPVYTLEKEHLPPDWSFATVNDLIGGEGVFVDGDWVESKDQDPDGDVRLIQLADIGDGEYRNRSSRFLTYDKAVELRCTFLKKGDVLIARMPDPLGRACIYPGDSKESVTVVDVAVVRSKNGDFSHRWLMYLSMRRLFEQQFLHCKAEVHGREFHEKILLALFSPYPLSNNKNASLRKSKNNSPGLMKPLPTSSASRPTSNATKPLSSKPLLKANSPKNGASSTQM